MPSSSTFWFSGGSGCPITEDVGKSKVAKQEWIYLKGKASILGISCGKIISSWRIITEEAPKHLQPPPSARRWTPLAVAGGHYGLRATASCPRVAHRGSGKVLRRNVAPSAPASGCLRQPAREVVAAAHRDRHPPDAPAPGRTGRGGRPRRAAPFSRPLRGLRHPGRILA